MRILYVNLLLLTALLFYQPAFAQKFNTEAVTQFWQVVDHLEKNGELPDSLWHAYYDLRGNKIYMENNRDAKEASEHRRYLELIFRPAKTDSLAHLQSKSANSRDDILKNLLYIKANEKALREYTKQITAPGYLPKCIALAKRYLPTGQYNRIPKNLTIYINAMTFDAAVQSPDMYFGLAIIYEFDRFQKGAIAAHELHHQLRVNKEIQKSVRHSDSTSFSIINQMNNEGTADLVDKALAVKYKATMYDAEGLSHWLFDDAASTIRKLDSAFLINSKAINGGLSYRDFRKITNYSSGHIPGFYMTNIIVRNGHKAQLIAHCDNPFYVFYLYNDIAKHDPKHPVLFSKATMEYLRLLEKRVYK